VVWLKRAKIEVELLSVKKILTAPSTLHKGKQKHRACRFFANSRWAILPPLLLADSRYLGISQQFSYIL
jgi:hypothetical protein